MLKSNLLLQELSLETDDDSLFSELNRIPQQNNDDETDQSEGTDDEYFDCFKYSVIVTTHPTKCENPSIKKLFEKDLNINPKLILKETRTTIMLKNIPLQYTVKDLIEEIETLYKEEYNFFYMPYDSIKNCNMGYAFINFINTRQVEKFYKIFDSRRWKLSPHRVCTLRYAKNQINNPNY